MRKRNWKAAYEKIKVALNDQLAERGRMQDRMVAHANAWETELKEAKRLLAEAQADIAKKNSALAKLKVAEINGDISYPQLTINGDLTISPHREQVKTS